MIKEFNDYLQQIKDNPESELQGNGGFIRYKQAKQAIDTLYRTSVETLIMTTVGDNSDKLQAHGIKMESKFEDELKVRNDSIYHLVMKILSMRFGYEELHLNMNNDRLFIGEGDDKMNKEELTYRQYEPDLIDFEENKGIHSAQSAERAKQMGISDKAVFLPMYHRSETLEFRILEEGIIKMTDLTVEDSQNTVVIMPLSGFEILDVILVDTEFTEFDMDREVFEGIRTSDAVRKAWNVVNNGVKGEEILNDDWLRYQRDIGQDENEEDVEEVEEYNELDDFDRQILNTLHMDIGTEDEEEVEEYRYRFTKSLDSIEQNNRLALLFDDAFKKYSEMLDYSRRKIVREKSMKVGKVINTVIKPQPQQQQSEQGE